MKVPFYFKKVNAVKIHCFRNKKASCRNSSLKYIHKNTLRISWHGKKPYDYAYGNSNSSNSSY